MESMKRTTSIASGAGRPLKMRMRPDLVASQQSYLGRRYWIVKDPLALKYYRFEEEEFAILEMIDGQASLEDIRRRFEEQFQPQKIAIADLHQLIGMLYRSSLVVADTPGQGTQLHQRFSDNRQRNWMSQIGNILSFRFKGWDPDRLLGRLDRFTGWFFSLPALFCCLLMGIGALLLIAVQFDVFRARLPHFHEFFAAQNWFALAATLAATKVLHEFGHGLSCKRFGGECHEMGVMMLVMTPCLYCNVSDSWMLPDKWKRAAIGAAGMYVELVLAAIATFVWWFSNPGTVHYLALNVMFVCSVSTLLFNANPLLRFDGYYILSDLAEIPNLRQKASTILHRKLGNWLLGLPEPHDAFLPQQRQLLFALYSISAALYRWIVTFSILWMLNKMFEPYGLKVIGQLIALTAVYGMLIQPLWQLGKYFHVPGRIEQVKTMRLMLTLSGSAVVVALLFFVPLPHFVRCTLYLQPRNAASVYVESPGVLRQINVSGGQFVQAGEPLLQLENVDLELQIMQLAGRRQELQSQLTSLRRRALSGDDSAAEQMDSVAETLTGIEEQLQRRLDDHDRLTISAPAEGVIIPAQSRPEQEEDAATLPAWTGNALEPHNVGAVLDESVLVCRIGDPRQLEAILAIDQADVEFVRPGQTVDIIVEQLPTQKFRTRISHVAEADMDHSPAALSQKTGGELATRTDGRGQQRPVDVTYQASSPVNDETAIILSGGTGNAKIHAGYQTLAQLAWRGVCRTFRFEM